MSAERQASEVATPYVCSAALIIAGEHYPCQTMQQMVPGSENHNGWAHGNRDAEAIWVGDEGAHGERQ